MINTTFIHLSNRWSAYFVERGSRRCDFDCEWIVDMADCAVFPKHSTLPEAIKIHDFECLFDLPWEEITVRCRACVKQHGTLAFEDEVQIVVMSVLFDNLVSSLKSYPFEVFVAYHLDEFWVQLSEARHHCMEEIVVDSLGLKTVKQVI